MIPRDPTHDPPWTDLDRRLDVRIAPIGEGRPPCEACVAPCCWYLLVEDDKVEGRPDLDAIERDLAYRDVVAWLDYDGDYALGLATPCRWLDPVECSCNALGKPARPSICDHYDENNCWYRWHVEADDSEVARVDGIRWASFRSALEQRPDRLPRSDSLERSRISYDYPVTLEFDLPPDLVDDPQDRADLLSFFSGFTGCRIVRSPDSWMLLFDTFRDSSAPAGSMEVRDSTIGGFAPEDIVHTRHDQLLDLASRYGEKLLEMTPDALVEALNS